MVEAQVVTGEMLLVERMVVQVRVEQGAEAAQVLADQVVVDR